MNLLVSMHSVFPTNKGDGDVPATPAYRPTNPHEFPRVRHDVLLYVKRIILLSSTVKTLPRRLEQNNVVPLSPLFVYRASLSPPPRIPPILNAVGLVTGSVQRMQY